ncbi:uncharacterized protein stbd1 isoform 2-T2 [Menidia menidia]
MQLTNGNPVSAEKRTDLASLFCVVGRHGPAVAAAVIAVVSVLAGFIIYRNAREKRRKAAAGAGEGDAKSRAAPSHAEPERPEEAPCRREATDVSEGDASTTKTDAAATRSNLKIRSRRGAVRKRDYSPAERDSEPDKNGLSPVQESYNMLAEENGEQQGKPDKVDKLPVDVTCSKNVTAEVEDSEGCQKPAATCEIHEEKVSKSEVTAEAVLGQQFSLEDLERVANSMNVPEFPETSQIQDDKSTPAVEGNEPVIQTDVPIPSTDAEVIEELIHPEVAVFCYQNGHNCLLPEEEAEDEEQKCVAVQTVSSKQTDFSSAQSSKPDQMDVLEMTYSGQDDNMEQLRPEEDDPICNSSSAPVPDDPPLNRSVKTDLTDVEGLCVQTSAAEAQISCSVALTDFSDQKPESEVLDEVAPELANDLAPDCLGLTEMQSKLKDGAVVFERVDHVGSSPQEEDPDTAGYENASFTAPSASAELPPPDLPPFKDQKNDQLQTIESLPEADSPRHLEAGMEEPVCQIQLLSLDQSELTWSSSGVGEESGISSMTVSPDLEDPEECDAAPAQAAPSVAEHYPEAEEPAEAQSRFFSQQARPVSQDAAGPAVGPLSALSLECHKEETEEDAKSAAMNDMFLHVAVHPTETGQFTVPVPTGDGCLAAFKKEVVVERKEGEQAPEEKADKTEISIMEATMDTNEWITDGAAGENADAPHSTEAAHASFLSNVEENAETGRKVVAVQPMPQNVNVTFSTHYFTSSPYQRVAITGNQQELGNWKDFVPLEKAKDGLWATVVTMPTESHVEWKFVVLDKGEVCRWEECGNRLLDTGYGDDLLVHKWWGLV